MKSYCNLSVLVNLIAGMVANDGDDEVLGLGCQNLLRELTGNRMRGLMVVVKMMMFCSSTRVKSGANRGQAVTTRMDWIYSSVLSTTRWLFGHSMPLGRINQFGETR